MQELVQTSEQYLTSQQIEESDSEGSHISSQDSEALGQLRHSDSLLLLTQVSIICSVNLTNTQSVVSIFDYGFPVIIDYFQCQAYCVHL